jgi:hypothetical protein
MDGLTTGFDFVLRDKTRRKGTKLAHKVELQEGYQLCIVLRISIVPIQQSSSSDYTRQVRTVVSTNSRIKFPLLRQFRQIHALRTDSH